MIDGYRPEPRTHKGFINGNRHGMTNEKFIARRPMAAPFREKRRHMAIYSLVVIGITAALVIGTFGYVYYDSEKRSDRLRAEKETKAIPAITHNYATLSVGDDAPEGSASTLTAYPLSNSVTVDGCIYITGSEWSDADYYFVDLSQDMTIYAKQDGTWLYLACMPVDTCAPPNPSEYNEVCFDTDSDGGTAPDADDKKFKILTDNTTAYYEGDGAAWQAASAPTWTGKVGFGNGNVNWEFKIGLSDIFGVTPPSGKTVKFIWHNFDNCGLRAHIWYKSTPAIETGVIIPTVEYCDNPSTYNTLALPELHEYVAAAMPLIIPIVLLVVKGGKRREAS